jgi:hypothetical protein
MSFKTFIYYCALCGGWAAFLAWGVVFLAKIRDTDSLFLRAALIGGLLGLLVAGAVGTVDALLNAVGFMRLVRVLLCMVIGLIGAVLGSLVGEALRQIGAPVFIGWILVGVAIGVSIGAFDVLRALFTGGEMRVPLKKILNGVIGGFLGGLVGGLPFGYLLANEQLPISNLTIGLVILGLCIGLLIGLAQVVLKEAWLRVEKGFRSGRELMLSKDVTTIGRAESCDLGLFGDNKIEKIHARILLKNNRYMLDDEETPTGTYLNDERVEGPTALRSGDTIRVGNSVLVFGERRKRKR